MEGDFPAQEKDIFPVLVCRTGMASGMLQDLLAGLGNPLGLLLHKPLDGPLEGEPGDQHHHFPVVLNFYGDGSATQGDADGVWDGFISYD
jgi:hypothetical protein